jgi:hypothetical protein
MYTQNSFHQGPEAEMIKSKIDETPRRKGLKTDRHYLLNKNWSLKLFLSSFGKENHANNCI